MGALTFSADEILILAHNQQRTHLSSFLPFFHTHSIAEIYIDSHQLISKESLL